MKLKNEKRLPCPVKSLIFRMITYKKLGKAAFPDFETLANESTGWASIYVRGTPRPQPRPRFVGGRVVATASASAKAWRAAVTAAARRAVQEVGGVSGPVVLSVRFDMPTKDAARWGKPHAMRPDADNLLKLIMDCLTRAGVWGDDCQVVAVHTYKIWARDGGAAIEVRAAVGQD